MKNESIITGSVTPINMKKTEIILNQMKNCICKILIENNRASGFFCKISKIKKNFLLTNYHVINEDYVKKNKEINIILNDGNEALILDLQIEREKYFNEEYDIALIEIKEKDKIKEYLELIKIYQYIYCIICMEKISVYHMEY